MGWLRVGAGWSWSKGEEPSPRDFGWGSNPAPSHNQGQVQGDRPAPHKEQTQGGDGYQILSRFLDPHSTSRMDPRPARIWGQWCHTCSFSADSLTSRFVPRGHRAQSLRSLGGDHVSPVRGGGPGDQSAGEPRAHYKRAVRVSGGGEGRGGEGRAGERRERRAGEGCGGEGWGGERRAGRGRGGEGRAGQGRAGQGRAADGGDQ